MIDDRITIISNFQPRDVLDCYELTEKERKEFTYLDWDEIDRGANPTSFVRYKGNVIDLQEFDRVNPVYPAHATFAMWDCIQADTFFSGILVKYIDNFERVIMGRYYS